MLWEKERFYGPTDLRKSTYCISAVDIHRTSLAKIQTNIENKTKNIEKFL